jgi:hypothetical protein
MICGSDDDIALHAGPRPDTGVPLRCAVPHALKALNYVNACALVNLIEALAIGRNPPDSATMAMRCYNALAVSTRWKRRLFRRC